MNSTFLPEDVTILLKDVTGMVNPLNIEQREKLIQAGKHYCEMLPIEYVPSNQYLIEYENALNNFSKLTAQCVKIVSEKIYKLKGKNLVLVSLARAGTPIGILIKRYLKRKYLIDFPHYTISIIRKKGIDSNAMKYILSKHSPKDIQFIDGWTGKGAILGELQKEVSKYKGISSELAVLCDPANITSICGTHEDFLIASSCLNSTVCGLISRTFLRDDIIKKDDFHGAVFYPELKEEDRTYEFIHKIESFINLEDETLEDKVHIKSGLISITGMEEVYKIARHFNIEDINLIKPGIGETTRVLLRRVPEVVLIPEKLEKLEQKEQKEDEYISHILKLACEKNVKVVKYPLKAYRACGIIKVVCTI